MADVLLDRDENVRVSDVVGWVVWDTAGNRYTSLDTRASEVPDTEIQIVLIYYFNPTGKCRVDKTRLFRRLTLTGRDDYAIPQDDGDVRLVKGRWAEMVVHKRVVDQASPEWWPPPRMR